MGTFKKVLPKHLGGHGNTNHIDEGALDEIRKHYQINSMLDIGCAFGEMISLCDNRDMSYVGIDGDYTIERKHEQVIIHDYTTGTSEIPLIFDLGWSIEFVEHVEEKFVFNYMRDFQKCNHVLITHAPPGKKGHHHVNCQNEEYWIRTFMRYGFSFNEELTNKIRKASTMPREFVREHGLFFNSEY